MDFLPKKKRHRTKAIVRRNYFGRIIIYTALIFVIIPEVIRLDVSLFWWIYISGYLILFPHIASYFAKHSPDPHKAEMRNMVVEGFCIGNLITAINFSLFPIIAIIVPQIIYIGFYGGLRYYGRALLSMAIGITVTGFIVGFNFDFVTGPHSTFISAGLTLLMVLGLVIQIRADYERSRNKIRKNKEHLEELSGKLSKYLSPQVYSQIFLGKKEVKLESYRKKLTVFFSDIVGFTHLTDNMESETLSYLLNSYFNEMSKIALKHGGTIDKYMGDAIMIFFGDPESRGEKEDALACINMAIEMREHMEDLRKMWDEEGISKALHIRMGVNTGYCTVGNFGSEDRLDYTIVGGQVNLTSRLEGRAETDQILISHETYALVKDKVVCDRRGDLSIKGLAFPVQTYQVIDLKEKLIHLEHEMNATHSGFSLSMDLDSLDRDVAIKTLKTAIQKIENRMNGA